MVARHTYDFVATLNMKAIQEIPSHVLRNRIIDFQKQTDSDREVRWNLTENRAWAILYHWMAREIIICWQQRSQIPKCIREELWSPQKLKRSKKEHNRLKEMDESKAAHARIAHVVHTISQLPNDVQRQQAFQDLAQRSCNACNWIFDIEAMPKLLGLDREPLPTAGVGLDPACEVDLSALPGTDEARTRDYWASLARCGEEMQMCVQKARKYEGYLAERLKEAWHIRWGIDFLSGNGPADALPSLPTDYPFSAERLPTPPPSPPRAPRPNATERPQAPLQMTLQHQWTRYTSSSMVRR